MKKSLRSSSKSAFSMLELIFVIVILGIVSSIGAEIIAKVYESYISQRAIQRSSIKVELAATQLANRLIYAVPGTVIGRRLDDVYLAIDDLPGGTDYRILQWIGTDEDSLGVGGWSGFAETSTATATSFVSPGSSATTLNSTISSLSYTTKTSVNAAIFFPDTYTPYTVGYISGGSDITGVNIVAGTATSTFTLAAKATRVIKEHYKLAWTSYAVVPVNQRGNIFDLELRYNFQPWMGNEHATGTSQLLIRNISVFKFMGTGDTTRFKICQQENIGGDFNITTCKEKAVIR